MEMVCEAGWRRRRHWKNPAGVLRQGSLCEQQVRAGGAAGQMLRGWPGKVLGEEDVKGCELLPVQPPASLELPCREEICRDEERREISHNFGLVAAVLGLCWSNSKEGMESKTSPGFWHSQDYP